MRPTVSGPAALSRMDLNRASETGGPTRRTGLPAAMWALLIGSVCWGAAPVAAQESQAEQQDWFIGLAKRDITPTEPLRLSGYAARDEPHTGVADPLHVRALVLAPQAAVDAEAVVLVSVDSIAVTEQLSGQTADWLAETYGIPRAQLVLSSTHSHAAPHLDTGLQNLFRNPPDQSQRAATARYTARVATAIREAITAAAERLRPGELSFGTGSCDFAVHRRLIREGSWVGFGVNDEGPVDRRVRVLLARDLQGQLLGAAFLYACHCTTLGPDFNRVSGDWAGLAASRLEQIHPAAVFLPIIGCGADANPNPRGTYELAQQHAAQLVDAVQTVVKRHKLSPLNEFPQARFGYAGLVPEQPSAELIEQRLQSDQPNERRWAERMRAIREEMGRLPESVPMPIHSWQFGDQLSWVFLGGEVVVDYQFQIEKELPTAETWVAAYCDDVFAYVSSEAMRSAGGYEVDFSMIYYLQPGRWESGTQQRIVRRVREIWSAPASDAVPLSATESARSIRLPAGYRSELVASEPAVQDPVNLAFGFDGRVWVVEMGDYPLGSPSGGRVKWLRDTNGDGSLDQVQLFADQLSYPTSVMPWGDGAIVIAAPEVLWIRDRDGDGVGDEREVLLSGLNEANPQHRASGFEIGLDGWLHFGVGSGTRSLLSHRNGREYPVAGQDVAWNPTSGEVRVTGGETQFVPARDAYGRWFGNSNSLPMYQFVIDRRYLGERRLPGGIEQHLLTPAVAPPVRPASRTVDRFNDLFAQQRFTSACGSIVARVPGMQPVGERGREQVAFVCEPVHNLVARLVIEPQGSALRGRRHPDDNEYDFFAATDTWARPVRIVNAPDGTLWVVDMSRRVIEHPEWIPQAWQQRVNLRSGEQQGRIYRIYHRDFQPQPLRRSSWEDGDVIAMLHDNNGAVRDLVALRIIQQPSGMFRDAVTRAWKTAPSVEAKISCLGALTAGGWLTADRLNAALRDADDRVVRIALQLVARHASHASFEDEEGALLDTIAQLATQPHSAEVDLQWLLTTSRLPGRDWSVGVAQIARRSGDDPWIAKALTLVRGERAVGIALTALLERFDQAVPEGGAGGMEIDALLPLWKQLSDAQRERVVAARLQPWRQSGAALGGGDLLLLRLLGEDRQTARQLLGDAALATLAEHVERALRSGADDAPWTLVGAGLFDAERELEWLRTALEKPRENQQRETIAACDRIASPAAFRMIVAAWSRLTPLARQQAGAMLVGHRGGVLALLAGLEAGEITKRDLGQSTIDDLRDYRDRVIRSRCVAVLGKLDSRERVVSRYLETMPNPAQQSSAAGSKLFDQHCAACHRAGADPAVGPALENLRHWTNRQWVSAILDPSQIVEPKYQRSSLLLEDGRVLTGLVTSDAGDRWEVVGSDGKRRVVQREAIEEVKTEELSLMPAGFEEQLTPAQLAQLIGYLRRDYRAASLGK